MHRSGGVGTTSSGLSGGVHIFLGSVASFVVQVVALITLSHMLDPSDFGLLAMAMVFVAFANLLRDFGLPTAGLQAQKLSPQQASNLFWMNVAVSILVAAILILSSSFLVAIYSEPRLASIIPVMAVVVVLGGIGAQIQVQLAREMRFFALACSDVASQILALLIAVALAAAGAGYWALVAQILMAAALTLMFRALVLRWRPMRFRRGHGARNAALIGADYGLAQMLTFAQANVDTLVIGAQLGATQLGYYSRAYQALTAPAGRLLDPLTQVVISTMNRAKARGQDPRPLMRRVQFLVAMGMTTMFAVAGGVAPNLIPIMLGPQWNDSVEVFQILAIGGCIAALNHVSYWLFIAFERSRDLLRYNLVSKPIAVGLIILGSFFGISGVAWGYVIAMAISWPLNVLWLWKVASVTPKPFIITGVRVLIVGSAVALASSAAMHVSSAFGSVGALAVGVLAGLTTTALATLLTPALRRDMSEWIQHAQTVVEARKR